MKDLYLNFPSQEQANTVLYEITPAVTETTVITPAVVDEQGVEVTAEVTETTIITPKVFKPNFTNIDIIGEIWQPTGNVTIGEDGMEIPETELIPGFHVNLRVISADTSEVEPFIVYPVNPVRVWAG